MSATSAARFTEAAPTVGEREGQLDVHLEVR